MKDDLKSLLIAFAFAIAICAVEVWCSRSSSKQPVTETQVLQMKDDSLEKENRLLNGKIDRMKRSGDSSQQQALEIKHEVIQLKKEQLEAITHIDSLTGHELYDFFSKFNTPDSAGR